VSKPIHQRSLHPSLRDPLFDIPKFHTEVMNKYPEAISFAPGAPNLAVAIGFEPSRHIDRFLQYAVDERGLDSQQAQWLLYEYGPSRGIINDLVAESLRRDREYDISPRDVVITVGAQEAMLLTLRVLCRGGDDLIAVVNPCFLGLTGAARLLDIGLVGVDESDDGIDFEQLVEACQSARSANRRIRALYIAPDYSNPSGLLLGTADRMRLLELAEQQDFFLIEDTTYRFTAAPGEELPTLKALDKHNRVIAIGTFAKICLPGARVGFVVASQQVQAEDGSERPLADEIAAAKGLVSLNTPAVSQAIIGGMLLDNGLSLARTGCEKAELYRRNLAGLLDALDRRLSSDANLTGRLWWNRPAGGFFVRMRLPVAVDEALLETSAAEFGVLWTPMAPFYLDGRGKDEIRLSCSYLSMEEIDEGVGRLQGFLRSL
jgi:(S)-3,5-dihydroxyphenylglycine transaminase